MSALQKDWKAQTAVIPTDITTVTARARFNSVQEWVRIKTALEQVSAIRSLKVQSLQSRQADMEIQFMGDVNRLQTALQRAQIDMRVVQPVSSGGYNSWWSGSRDM